MYQSYTQVLKDLAIEHLKTFLQPTDTIHCVMTAKSKKKGTIHMHCYVAQVLSNKQIKIVNVTQKIANALGLRMTHTKGLCLQNERIGLGFEINLTKLGELRKILFNQTGPLDADNSNILSFEMLKTHYYGMF